MLAAMDAEADLGDDTCQERRKDVNKIGQACRLQSTTPTTTVAETATTRPTTVA